MKATLIYIECGHYSGVMRILIDETVFSIELGTPNYNDYGEYRLRSMDIKPMSLTQYKERFPHELMNHEICELSSEDMEFWNRVKLHTADWDDPTMYLTDEDLALIELSEDGCGQVTCGQDKDKVYHIYHNGKWIPYEKWKTDGEDNHYTRLMYPVAELFFNWFNKKLVLSLEPETTDGELRIYPD